tara:strand:+ start:1376 stop:1639 length:264 start_codon:yes stop_codon:yes gene_type:complete
MRNIKSQMIVMGAVEQPDGSYIDTDRGWRWWFNEYGQRHREDGPAIFTTEGHIYWCFNDNQDLDFNEWCMLTNKTDEEKMMLRLQYA